jgi:hypothetical protein
LFSSFHACHPELAFLASGMRDLLFSLVLTSPRLTATSIQGDASLTNVEAVFSRRGLRSCRIDSALVELGFALTGTRADRECRPQFWHGSAGVYFVSRTVALRASMSASSPRNNNPPAPVTETQNQYRTCRITIHSPHGLAPKKRSHIGILQYRYSPAKKVMMPVLSSMRGNIFY